MSVGGCGWQPCKSSPSAETRAAIRQVKKAHGVRGGGAIGTKRNLHKIYRSLHKQCKRLAQASLRQVRDLHRQGVKKRVWRGKQAA